MRKVLPSLLAAALVATGAVLISNVGKTQAAVGGPVCNVPADYSTIQAAVDAPGCNTVKVTPGAYSENVTITRSVNVKGAKAGVGVSSRSFPSASESTVTGPADTAVFTVNAANVTIDGFAVTNPNHGLGIDIKTAGNNAAIKNNIVDGIGSAAYTPNTVGVYLELGPDSVAVTGNRINNVQSGPSAQGILIGDSSSTNPSLDAQVADNTISNITSTAKGAYGVQVNNGARSTGFATVKILNNTIKDLNGAGWVHAIGLEGKTPNVVVRHNTISNLVSTSPDKVAVWFEDNIFFFTGDVNRNSLNVGPSAYGIAVQPSLVAAYPSLNVDGQCNWWGAANGPGPVGPGSGSLVSNGVDYSPWLKTSNLNGKCDDNNNHNDNHDGDSNNHDENDD
jgi:hypothetical protein